MKNDTSSLDRLLRSASQSTPHSAEEVPFGFTTRVVSGWVSASPGDAMNLQALWFRRSFVAALAVMALSVGWCFKTDTAAPNDEMAIASYATTSDLQ
jgi:hypothetical protein